MTRARPAGHVAVALAVALALALPPAGPAAAADAPESAPESAPASAPAPALPPGTAPPRAKPPKAEAESTVSAYGYVTFFLGLTLAGGGFGLDRLAVSKARALDLETGDDGMIEWHRYEQLVRQGSEIEIAAYTLMGAGIAVGAAGIYLLLRKKKSAGFIIALTPVPGGGVALASGAF